MYLKADAYKISYINGLKPHSRRTSTEGKTSTTRPTAGQFTIIMQSSAKKTKMWNSFYQTITYPWKSSYDSLGLVEARSDQTSSPRFDTFTLVTSGGEFTLPLWIQRNPFISAKGLTLNGSICYMISVVFFFRRLVSGYTGSVRLWRNSCDR